MSSLRADKEENKPFLVLAINVESISGTSNLIKRPVSCTNIIKMYEQGIGGVDMMHQKSGAYQLD